jgi:hypothetical protein
VRRVLLGLLVPAIAGAAFWAGRASHRETPVSPTADAHDDLRRQVADLEDALNVFRRELVWLGQRLDKLPAGGGGGVAGPALAAPAASAPPRAPERTQEPATLAKLQEADVLLQDAVARGTWTEADVARLDELIREAPQGEWVAVMQRIDVAINQGKIRPQPHMDRWH